MAQSPKNHKLRKLASFLGVDKAIAYTVVGKGLQVISGPITLLLIAHYLTPVEQGFYYTFASIVNLQIFFELGLSFVILQFASHEKAKLEWTFKRRLQGDITSKVRLASLLELASKWYGAIAIFMIISIAPIGFLFLKTNSSQITSNWQLPWICVVVTTSATLFLSPFLSFLEGCGLVAEIARLRVIQTFLTNILVWISLSFGLNLYVAALPNLVGSIIAILWLFKNYKNFFVDLWMHRPTKLKLDSQINKSISWRNEIFPLQWRIAVSWASGYLIFFLFTPITFKFQGAAEAGRMGMSLSIAAAISGLSYSWISTKAAPFGILVASKKFKELDQLFFPALWQSCGVSGAGGIILLVSYYFLKRIESPISLRLLEMAPLTLLSLTVVVNVYVFGLALYLRSHKKEPFMRLSIINGILMTISSLFMGRYYGADGMMLGYFAINTFVIASYASYIFLKKRKEWHFNPLD